MTKLLQVAKTSKNKIEEKILKLKNKISSLEKELKAINTVIAIYEPTGDIQNGSTLAQSHTIKSEPKEECRVSHTDLIRLFLVNNKTGTQKAQMSDFVKTAYPSKFDSFQRNLDSALFYLGNRGEVIKAGSGSLAIFTPTDKLEKPIVQ